MGHGGCSPARFVAPGDPCCDASVQATVPESRSLFFAGPFFGSSPTASRCNFALPSAAAPGFALLPAAFLLRAFVPFFPAAVTVTAVGCMVAKARRPISVSGQAPTALFAVSISLGCASDPASVEARISDTKTACDLWIVACEMLLLILTFVPFGGEYSAEKSVLPSPGTKV